MSTIDKQAMRWLVRNADQTRDHVERREFAAWFEADIRHKGAYARAAAIHNAMGKAAEKQSLGSVDEDRYESRLDAPWRQEAARRSFLRFGALAAGLAVMAGTAVFSVLPEESLLVAAKGEFRKVQLADHSVASVNSGSSLDVVLSRSARDITLRHGEAWFEVAKDKARPFTVAAGDVHARAVGTAFGVRRYSNGAEVMVTEGVVEVWSNEAVARKILLQAGDMAFVPNQAAKIAVSRQPEEIERKLAWRKGQVIFINQTLNEAVADFNRYSLRKIVIADPQLGNRTLVGQYPIDSPEVFAKDVSAFMDVPLEITADRIMIGNSRTASKL